jgi:oligopeptide transport system ATP-binding protein
LGVVANVADRVAVMYAGKIVETGLASEIYYNPKHPYTWGLLSSIPSMSGQNEEILSIPGTPPNLIQPPKGDAFAYRSDYAMAIDFEEHPPMFQVSDTHFVASWLLHPDAPKVNMPSVLQARIDSYKKRGDTHE